MRVAVTGVSGFIGSILAKTLHEGGHSVTGLVRKSSRREHVQPFVDHFVLGEQHDENVWPELLDGADCIIHNSLDWPGDPDWNLDRHLQSNLVGSIKLLEHAAPRQFIYISSVGALHDIRPAWDGVIDEDHPLRPANLYGALKASVEAHLWAAHYSRGQHTCAHRPCAVYGIDPNLERSHGFALIQKLKRGERISKPGGGKFVHVDDVAAAVIATIGNPKAAGRAFNLVDCYARWADWAVIAAKLLGEKADIDTSSPAQPKNEFSKESVHSLGVKMDRGHDGIREYLRELIEVMESANALP
jgi:nucleoside-diphosphate-sugar epimerase